MCFLLITAFFLAEVASTGVSFFETFSAAAFSPGGIRADARVGARAGTALSRRGDRPLVASHQGDRAEA